MLADVGEGGAAGESCEAFLLRDLLTVVALSTTLR